MNKESPLPNPRPPVLAPRLPRDPHAAAEQTGGASLERRRPLLPARRTEAQKPSLLNVHATPEARGYGAG